MQVTPVMPTFSGKNIYIPRNIEPNRDRKFLYNEVVDIIKEHHTPAVVGTKGIEISATDKVIEKLKEIGVKFVDKLK